MKPYLGTHNTFDKVNHLQLSMELAIRGVRCERPGCSMMAFYMATQAWTVFLCYDCWMTLQQWPDRILKPIASFHQMCGEQILEAALTGNHQLIEYPPT